MLQLVRGRESSPTFMTSGPDLTCYRQQGVGGMSHHMVDDGQGRIPHAPDLGQFTCLPVNRVSSTVLLMLGVGSVFPGVLPLASGGGLSPSPSTGGRGKQEGIFPSPSVPHGR